MFGWTCQSGVDVSAGGPRLSGRGARSLTFYILGNGKFGALYTTTAMNLSQSSWSAHSSKNNLVFYNLLAFLPFRSGGVRVKIQMP